MVCVQNSGVMMPRLVESCVAKIICYVISHNYRVLKNWKQFLNQFAGSSYFTLIPDENFKSKISDYVKRSL